MNQAMSSYGFVRSPYGWFYDPSSSYHPSNTNSCSYYPPYDRSQSHGSYSAHVSSRSGPSGGDNTSRFMARQPPVSQNNKSSSSSATTSSSAGVPHAFRGGNHPESQSGTSFLNNDCRSLPQAGADRFLSPKNNFDKTSFSSQLDVHNDPDVPGSSLSSFARTSPSTQKRLNRSASGYGGVPEKNDVNGVSAQETRLQPHRALLDITNRSSRQPSVHSNKHNDLVNLDHDVSAPPTTGRVSGSIHSYDTSVTKPTVVEDVQSVTSDVHSVSPSSTDMPSGMHVLSGQDLDRQRSTSNMSVSNASANDNSSSSSSATTANGDSSSSNTTGDLKQHSRGMLDLLCQATDIVIKNMEQNAAAPKSMTTFMDMISDAVPAAPAPAFHAHHFRDQSFSTTSTASSTRTHSPLENITTTSTAQHFINHGPCGFIQPIKTAPSNVATATTNATLRISPSNSTQSDDEKTSKPCSCPRSQCIKLYCDCFQAGKFCSAKCSCKSCKNLASENGPGGLRTRAIQNILSRNPFAFHKDKDIMEKLNNRAPGINCRCVKSQCLKLYCDCFQAGEVCGENCLCIKCMNTIAESGDYGKRTVARAVCLSRNPDAFKKKVKKTGEGCSCKNSKCLKKYCDCFNNGMECSSKCICRDCENRDLDALGVAKVVKNEQNITRLTIPIQGSSN